MTGPLLAVHPEHVSLAFLISALVAPPPPEQGWGHGFDGPTAQRLLALFLLEEIQDVSSPTHSPLPVLLTKLQQRLGQAGVVLAHAFVNILRGLSSPDDIVNVLQNFSTLLAQPGSTPTVATDACSIAYIGSTSPLGLFLRRVRFGLSNMGIQGLAALSDQIQQQLQQLAMQQYQTSPGSSSGGRFSSSGALKEQAVLEAYVNQLLSAIETQGQSLPAVLVEAATAQLQQLELELPKLEYLRMAVSLAHKDMPATISSLHQYFDYSGSATTAGAGAAAGTTTGGPGSTATGLAAAVASKGKGKHQAALHALSAVQASLGHPQESLAALQELLRLGQQAGDEWGLLHALSGLCRVMGMSEGLQLSSSSSTGSSSSAGASGDAAAGNHVGWGLLDLRRTEQQLQLQTLLQRGLTTARDMRAPHIAAFAAVALCRFRLQHAAAAHNDTAGEAASVAAAAAGANGSEASTITAAGTSLSVQRMLLDVSTLEHQAAVAAAAPSTPAVAATPANAATGVAPNIAARSTSLYNPSEAFGTGTNTTVVTTVPAATAAAAAKVQPIGRGWYSSAAAVSQALATAHLVAAAAMQLQGANGLAAVRLLMLLTGPGGAPANTAAAAAAVEGGDGGALPAQQQHNAASHIQQQVQLPKGATSCITGCGVRYEDISAGWAQAVMLVAHSQGVAAAEFALNIAAAHFTTGMPEQLTAAQQVLRVKRAIQAQDLPAARLACEELQSLANPQPQLGVDMQLAAAEADALTHAAAGCWEDVHAAAASLFAVAASSGMQPQAIKALLLLGRACLQAGDLSGALPYALSAMLHCQQLQLDALLPEAVLLVAAVWQGVAPGGSAFVKQLLQQVMSVVCAGGDLKLQAELQEAAAKMTLNGLQESIANGSGSPGEAAETKPAAAAAACEVHGSSNKAWTARQQHASGVVSQRLAAAAALYEQAGCWSSACDVWLLLAHVSNAAGHHMARNAAAEHWQAARQQLLHI